MITQASIIVLIGIINHLPTRVVIYFAIVIIIEIVIRNFGIIVPDIILQICMQNIKTAINHASDDGIAIWQRSMQG